MIIIRPSDRVIHIPGFGVTIHQPRGAAAAAATWWDNGGAISGCIIAYAAKGAASYAASKLNLAVPGTDNAADGTAYPSWAAGTGWTFDGATQYLTTGAHALKPVTILARVVTTGTGYRSIIGAGGIGGLQLRTNSRKPNLLSQWSADIASDTAPFGSGVDIVVGISYSATGVYQFYQAGVPTATGANDQTMANAAICIGKNGSGDNEWWIDQIDALAIYTAVLSTAEAATVSAAMAAL